MKVVIAGSRTLTTYAYVVEAMRLAANRGIYPVTEVVSGNARGVDLLGERWAFENNVPVARFPVSSLDWKRIGKAAGHYRNQRMAMYGDALVAVWDGYSPGTKGMVRLARGRTPPMLTFVFNPYQ